MNWIVIATIAYFLFAIAAVVDKLIVGDRLKPTTYAFFVGLLSGVVSSLLIPLGFDWIGYKLLYINLISGICFVIALVFLYTSLQKKESSRIVPIIGGMQPIIIFVLAYFLLAEALSSWALVSFVLIVAGSFILGMSQGKEKIGRPAIYYVILTALFFAVSLTLEKYVYDNHDSFFSVLIWNRYGNLLAAVILFSIPKVRKNILKTLRSKLKVSGKLGTSKIFILGQTAGSFGAILQRYAIMLGSVTLVSALQGTHYVFLLILTTILTVKFPKILKENITKQILAKKIFAIVLISLGVFALTLS